MARRSYGRFIQQGLGEGYREAFHHGAEDARLLGDDDFLEKTYRQVAAKVVKPPTLKQVIQAVCRDYGFKRSELSAVTRQRGPAEARAVIGYLAVELGSGSLSEVGRYFGRDVVTLSEGVKRMKSKMLREKQLAMRVEEIRRAFDK